MDEKILKIKEFLSQMSETFLDLKFICGYGASKHIYIVEVKPLSTFNNDEYARKELEFCNYFDSKYIDDCILFVSDDDLCKVDEVLFMVGYEDSPRYTPNNLKFNCDFDSWIEFESNDNYYKAA